MFKDAMRKRMMQQITPSETAVGQSVADILTVTEFNLFQAVDRLVEAADDVDAEFVVDQSMEERRDRLLELADAVAAQDFETWWWEEYAADFIDQPERARKFSGLSKEQWREAIERFAETRRDQIDEDPGERTDAQLAAELVEDAFGVDLATFASEVVEWDAAEHVDGIVRRNLHVSTQTIHQVAGALEAVDQEDVDDE